MDEMVKKIIEFICEAKEGTIDPDSLNKKSNLLEDAGLDSLQLIKFILLVEDEYEMEFDFDTFDYELLNSIEEFCTYVQSQMKKE